MELIEVIKFSSSDTQSFLLTTDKLRLPGAPTKNKPSGQNIKSKLTKCVFVILISCH